MANEPIWSHSQLWRDLLIVVEGLYAIRNHGWNLNDEQKDALARLDPEFAERMAESDVWWRRFKKHRPTCGR